MSFSVLNILDIMEDSGEDDIRDALSAFSCPAKYYFATKRGEHHFSPPLFELFCCGIYCSPSSKS